MSADDDTFEIDIYGDDQLEQEPVKEETHDDAKAGPVGGDNTDQQTANQEPSASATPAIQAQKRKASDMEEEEFKQEHGAEGSYDDYVDNRPLDPGAMPSLKLADLHWWTTEEDVRGFCAQAGAEEELHEVCFGEHKINGKSKGEAYLEFSSPQAATAVKREIEAASQVKEESGVRRTPFTAYFTPVGNPYKTSAGAGSKKDFSQQNGSQSGAYNSFPNSRGRGGGFGGRGNFNQSRGGGGFNNNNNNMMQNRTNQQAGWGMNNMGGNMGGYSMNPMMAGGFGNMNMGYGNMGRGGMMNNMGAMMGGRGGYGGMGMGNMNMGGMMGSRGGSGMMGGGGRGGWGGGAGGAGGFQQGYGGGFGAGGGGMQQQGQAAQGNKRMRTE